MIKYRRITLNGKSISTWDTFHKTFAEKLGFPEFYGKNMDAWIDCIQSIKNPEDGMTNIHLKNDELLIFSIENVKYLIEKNPAILRELNDCSAFLNHNFLDDYGRPIIIISYDT